MNVRTNPKSIRRWWRRFGDIFTDVVRTERYDNQMCEINWRSFGGKYDRMATSRLDWPDHRCGNDKWPEHWTIDNPKPVTTLVSK